MKGLNSAMPRCLSAETIAAFASNLLFGDELKRVQIHLEECDHCRARVDKVSKATERFDRESGVTERVKSVGAIRNWISNQVRKPDSVPSELIDPIRLIREHIISPIDDDEGVRTDERKKLRYQKHTGILPLALEPESLEQMLEVKGLAAPAFGFLATEGESDDYQVEVIRLGENECIRETYMAEAEKGKRHFYVGIQNAKELGDKYTKLRVVVELSDQDELLERLIDLHSPAPVASLGEINREDITAIELYLLEDDHAEANES